MRQNQRGFTLIELMVVIVVIGILVMITLANYISMQDRARVGHVRESMHVVQLTVEAFSTRNNGAYPANAATVTADGGVTLAAMLPGGAMPLNPFTGVATNLDWTNVLLSPPTTDAAGGISLNVIQSVAGGAYDRYDIVGENEVGVALAQVYKNY
jgi:prepilin-type N-terminal cleavage/methylation domain-containing protein